MQVLRQRSILEVRPFTIGARGPGAKCDKATIAGADSAPDNGSGALVLDFARAAEEFRCIDLSTIMVSSLRTRSHVRLSCRHTVRKRDCAEGIA